MLECGFTTPSHVSFYHSLSLLSSLLPPLPPFPSANDHTVVWLQGWLFFFLSLILYLFHQPPPLAPRPSDSCGSDFPYMWNVMKRIAKYFKHCSRHHMPSTQSHPPTLLLCQQTCDSAQVFTLPQHIHTVILLRNGRWPV